MVKKEDGNAAAGTTGSSTGAAGAPAPADGAGGAASADDSKAFNLGLSDSTGHKGAIAINDTAPIESVILTYQVVRKLADHICSRIKERYGRCSVLMHNPADFVALRELRSFFVASTEYTEILNRLTAAANASLASAGAAPHGAGFAGGLELPIIGGVINSVLQIFSLFRSDEDIKSFAIPVEDQVLAITVAGRLVAEGCKVVSSSVVPVDPLRTSNVLTALTDLRKLRGDLAALLDRLKAPLAGSSTNTTSKTNASSSQDSKKAELIARIDEALKSYDAFEQGVTKPDDKTGETPLSRVMAVESIDDLLKKDVCILWVRAVAAGGAAHAKVSSFTGELTYSGGAVISYAIFNNEGVLQEADTVPMYGGKLAVRSLPDGIKLGLEPYGVGSKEPAAPPAPTLTKAEELAAGTFP